MRCVDVVVCRWGSTPIDPHWMIGSLLHPRIHFHRLHDTGAATVVAVNSRFTAQAFREAFARIAPRHPDPAVIYPAINLDSFVPPRFDDDAGAEGGNGRRQSGKGKQQQAAPPFRTYGVVRLHCMYVLRRPHSYTHISHKHTNPPQKNTHKAPSSR